MKRLYLVLAVGAALVALGVLSSVVTQGFSEVASTQAELRQLEQERAQLERHIDQLAATIKAVKSDPKAVESIARYELGWIRPGEKVIVLVEPTPPPPPPGLTGEEAEPILRLP
ncbi:MAG: septum formation initiator family protein [Thermoanaerobaculales bacterium]|nr:septum formation initiator family protein [Thermoanaerobaculales bacterium]